MMFTSRNLIVIATRIAKFQQYWSWVDFLVFSTHLFDVLLRTHRTVKRIVIVGVHHVIQELQKIHVVRFITTISGEYPLLAQINVRDYEEINETVKQIHAIPNVTSTNVMVQMDVFKNTFEFL